MTQINLTKQLNLTEQLNFKDDDLFLNGKKIFSVTHIPCQSGINLVGLSSDERTIYVGSGQCCYGPISILTNKSKKEEIPNFQLSSFRIPDFNVYDIIPIHVNYEKTGFCNDGAILTTGYGCAGSGVRLIDTYYPKTIDIISTTEFHEMWDSRQQGWVMPHLYVDEQKCTITLDLLKAGFRLKPGKSRDPTLPSILLDSNAEQFYISQDVWNSKDLTNILDNLGVNIEKTIQLNKNYTRIRHN